VECYDFNRKRWSEVAPLPLNIENAAACSADRFIYVFGGEINTSVSNRIYKFDENWIMLDVNLPFSLRNMGVIYHKEKFVVFGGMGNKLFNGKWFTLDKDLKLVTEADFQMTGFYSHKAVGRIDDKFSIVIDEDNALEYENGLFIRVCTQTNPINHIN
jgi:hypothetical protein